MDHEASNEDGNSPGVFSQFTQQKGERCVRDSETDHYKSHSVNTHRARNERLQTKKAWVTIKYYW